MLHDLGSLDAQGVSVDTELAARAVGEAEQWVERLCVLPARSPSSNGERGKAPAALAPAPRGHSRAG
jgi:hypothetical protein